MKRMKQTIQQMSFADYYVEQRSASTSVFYNQINTLVDWSQIEKEINRYYHKGETLQGCKPYGGVLLFKMLLLGMWNDLSDIKTENHVRDSLSATRFCGLKLEDPVPDHSTLSRFRSELTANKGMDKILLAFNRQFEKHHLTVRTGIKVDASLTESPRKPKGAIRYEIAEDRGEDEVPQEERKKQAGTLKKLQGKGVDAEGRWLKKGKRTVFGFKRHDAVDENGMIPGVHTTTANQHDSRGLKPLLKKIPRRYTRPGVAADKGYKVSENDKLLSRMKVKNRLMHKAYRDHPLTGWQKLFNNLISKTRWVVERAFGSIKKWFGGGKARYVGLSKTHTQHVLLAIAYNLKRAPGLVVSNSLKTT
jgi:IS5 family transposase